MGSSSSKSISRRNASTKTVPVDTDQYSAPTSPVIKPIQQTENVPQASKSDKTVDLCAENRTNRTAAEVSNRVSISWPRVAPPRQSPALSSSRKRSSSTDYLPDRILPNTLWEGQQLCLQDDVVRAAFVDYVLSSLWQFDLNSRFTDILNRKLPAQEASDYIIFNDYLVHPKSKSTSLDQKERDAAAARMMKCTQLKVKDSMSGESIRRSSTITETMTGDTALLMVLTSLWPLFYTSNAFSLLRSGGESPSTPETPSLIASSAPLNVASRAAEVECLRRINDFFVRTLRPLKAEYITSVLAGGRWANAFLESINTMNMSIAIAAVDVRKNCYTSVFVNNAFEAMKKSKRGELLGKPCDILRSSHPGEEDVASKIDMCLSRCLGIKIVIQNTRKDGSEFTNLLCVRPVLNWAGDYNHVITVSCDASREDLSLKDLRMANDFQLIFWGIMRG